jgi:ADP-ribose pyrophosphatase
MNRDDVEIIEKKTKFKGFFRLDCYRLRHRLFEGGWSEVRSQEVFERGNAAAALLYDPDNNAVVLIEQFRPGAFTSDRGTPWLVEIVAGMVEDGEDVEQTIRREAIEESGSTILDIVPMVNVFASPGGSSEIVSLFCGRVDSRDVGGIHGHAVEGENIRVIVEPADIAFKRLRSGDIHNAIFVIALQWLEKHGDALRQTWLVQSTG